MTVFRNLRRRKNYSGNVWTTKDGTKIAVEDMTDSHLENAINHLVRQADRQADWANRNLDFMEDYGPQPQGEMAQMLWESSLKWDPWQENHYQAGDFLGRSYWMLLDEKKRRGL